MFGSDIWPDIWTSEPLKPWVGFKCGSWRAFERRHTSLHAPLVLETRPNVRTAMVFGPWDFCSPLLSMKIEAQLLLLTRRRVVPWQRLYCIGLMFNSSVLASHFTQPTQNQTFAEGDRIYTCSVSITSADLKIIVFRQSSVNIATRSSVKFVWASTLLLLHHCLTVFQRKPKHEQKTGSWNLD